MCGRHWKITITTSRYMKRMWRRKRYATPFWVSRRGSRPYWNCSARTTKTWRNWSVSAKVRRLTPNTTVVCGVWKHSCNPSTGSRTSPWKKLPTCSSRILKPICARNAAAMKIRRPSSCRHSAWSLSWRKITAGFSPTRSSITKSVWNGWTEATWRNRSCKKFWKRNLPANGWNRCATCSSSRALPDLPI